MTPFSKNTPPATVIEKSATLDLQEYVPYLRFPVPDVATGQGPNIVLMHHPMNIHGP